MIHSLVYVVVALFCTHTFHAGMYKIYDCWRRLNQDSNQAAILVKREGFNSWIVSFTPDKPGVHQVSVKMPDSSLAISCAIDVASKQKDPYWEPQEGEID